MEGRAGEMKEVNMKLEGFELTIYVDSIYEDAVELSIGLSDGDRSETFQGVRVNELDGVAIPLVVDVAATVTPKAPNKVTR